MGGVGEDSCVGYAPPLTRSPIDGGSQQGPGPYLEDPKKYSLNSTCIKVSMVLNVSGMLSCQINHWDIVTDLYLEEDSERPNSLVFKRSRRYKELQRDFLMMVYSNQDQVIQVSLLQYSDTY